MTAKKSSKVAVGTAVEPKAPKAPKVSADVSAVVVKGTDGVVIREYSKKVHGEDFLTHAKEFASKRADRVVEEA